MKKLEAALAMLSVVALISVLAGCASSPSARPVYPPAVYANRVSTPHVDVYWSCTRPQADTVRLEGVVQNTKGVVKFVELEGMVTGLGGRGDSSAKTALPDVVLRLRQTSPFSLQLRTSGEEGVDLFYVYHIEAPDEEDSRQHYRARDVCSPTAHAIRRAGE
jgi:hypothetical protein